jgi:hypothetical protein
MDGSGYVVDVMENGEPPDSHGFMTSKIHNQPRARLPDTFIPGIHHA